MKTLVPFFVSLLVSSTVFAQVKPCASIGEALQTVQQQLAKDYAAYNVATSSHAKQAAVQELLLSVTSAEKAVEVTNAMGCLDLGKSNNPMNNEKYTKLKEKALNAEGSQNPVVRRAAAAQVDLAYSLANLREK